MASSAKEVLLGHWIEPPQDSYFQQSLSGWAPIVDFQESCMHHPNSALCRDEIP